MLKIFFLSSLKKKKPTPRAAFFPLYTPVFQKISAKLGMEASPIALSTLHILPIFWKESALG